MFTFYVSFQESKNFSKWKSAIKVECLESEMKLKEHYNYGRLLTLFQEDME